MHHFSANERGFREVGGSHWTHHPHLGLVIQVIQVTLIFVDIQKMLEIEWHEKINMNKTTLHHILIYLYIDNVVWFWSFIVFLFNWHIQRKIGFQYSYQQTTWGFEVYSCFSPFWSPLGRGASCVSLTVKVSYKSRWSQPLNSLNFSAIGYRPSLGISTWILNGWPLAQVDLTAGWLGDWIMKGSISCMISPICIIWISYW